MKHPLWGKEGRTLIRIGHKAEIYHWLSDKNITGRVYNILPNNSFTLITENGDKYRVCFDKRSKTERDDRLIRRIK